MLVVDMSNHGGEWTAEEVERAKAAGVRAAIIGAGPGSYGKWTQQQGRAAWAGGLEVMVYGFQELDTERRWNLTPEQWADAIVESAKGLPVRVWVLDAEDPTNGKDWSVEKRVEAYLRCARRLDELTGRRAEIYTGRWYLDGYLGGTHALSVGGRKLHNSWYDLEPDIDGLPYGGWTAADVFMEQFTGTTELGGQSVDLNWCYFIPGEEDEMAGEATELLLKVASVVAGWSTGQPFASVPEALSQFDALEEDDQRVLIGIGNTQRITGEIAHALEELRAVVEAMSPVGGGLTAEQIGIRLGSVEDALVAVGESLADWKAKADAKREAMAAKVEAAPAPVQERRATGEAPAEGEAAATEEKPKRGRRNDG